MKKVIVVMGIAVLALCSCVCKKSESTMADSQTLKKADATSIAKYWKLIELSGNPVTVNENMQRIPHIVLTMDGKLRGNTGCNNIVGAYEQKDSYRIKFSPAATTMMMCIDNMEIEKEFLRVLELADSYIVKDDTLILNRARMAPLARLVAVYME